MRGEVDIFVKLRKGKTGKEKEREIQKLEGGGGGGLRGNRNQI